MLHTAWKHHTPIQLQQHLLSMCTRHHSKKLTLLSDNTLHKVETRKKKKSKKQYLNYACIAAAAIEQWGTNENRKYFINKYKKKVQKKEMKHQTTECISKWFFTSFCRTLKI